MARGAAITFLCGTLSVLAVASTAAKPRSGPVCGPERAATVVEGKRGRIYALDGSEPPLTERIMGCLRSTTHSQQLSPAGYRGFGPRLLSKTAQLNPPWAGGVMDFVGTDFYRLSVRARNLRTGAPVECSAGGGGPIGGIDTRIKSLVLSATGALVWSSASTVRGRERDREIQVCTETGAEVLDEGEGINLYSLRLRGSSVTWLDSGTRRTAELP